MNLKSIRLFVFDFDGTLRVTNLIKENCFKEIALSKGISLDLLKTVMDKGGNRFEIFKALSEHSENCVYPEIVEEFTKSVHRKVCASKHLPGARKFVETLIADSHKKVCILSATPHEELMKIIIDEYGQGCFDDVLGTSNKIDALRDLMDKYSVEPKETLMVGDQEMDQEAAMENETHFLAVKSVGSWKNNKVPDHVITDYFTLIKRL